VVHDSPIGIVGPKGMAPERVKVLHDAFQKALSDPGFLKAMVNYEMPVLYQNSAEFAKFWAEAYVEAGVQVKNYMKP
jgi:tripartite-type tricarboxylate transporter receptor subunit TctC